ncbi:MAG: ATP-binding protein [Bradymonadia bacterium]
MSEGGTAEILTTQVDLPGLMKVLGHNLYSTPSVALRELVQNAHDACERRAMEDPEGASEPQITLRPDPKRRCLIIEDTGAGLTRDEIVRYLATVGSGYTGRMRAEAKTEDESPDADQTALIGRFGLGFLSAFFVSTKVELVTTSYQSPDEAWRFTSTGGERYHLAPAQQRPVGTEITLHLSEAFEKLAEPEVCEALLVRYCGLLRHPISMGGAAPVNRPEPPWRRADWADLPPVRRAHLQQEFAGRFEPRFEPICVIPMPEDGPIQGLLWVQDGATYGTSDNRNLSVFVRGMLVSAEVQQLLPMWAGFCGGVVESAVLTPTASREDLQRDAAWHEAEAAIREALIDGLSMLPEAQPAAWRRVLKRHNEALLGAALCDTRLFSLLADALKVPTTEGDLPMTAVKRRGPVHVTLGEQGGYEEVLFRALQVPVVLGTRYGALPFAERYMERLGGKVIRLGTESGNASLFSPATLDDADLARLRGLLGADGQMVVPTRFAPASLPAVLVPDQDVALRRRLEKDEADKRITTTLLSLARSFTAKIDDTVAARLYVNLDAPVIQGLLEAPRDAAHEARQRQVAQVVRALADLTTDRNAAKEAVGTDTGVILDTLTEALTGMLGDT